MKSTTTVHGGCDGKRSQLLFAPTKRLAAKAKYHWRQVFIDQFFSRHGDGPKGAKN
jgi:hypothetical protein